MKKLLLLIALVLISCDKYEEECECEKITYINYKEHLVISIEPLGCVPEEAYVHVVENIYYNISCKY